MSLKRFPPITFGFTPLKWTVVFCVVSFLSYHFTLIHLYQINFQPLLICFCSKTDGKNSSVHFSDRSSTGQWRLRRSDVPAGDLRGLHWRWNGFCFPPSFPYSLLFYMLVRGQTSVLYHVCFPHYVHSPNDSIYLTYSVGFSLPDRVVWVDAYKCRQ